MAKRIMMKKKRMIKHIKTMYADNSFFCFLFISYSPSTLFNNSKFCYRTKFVKQYPMVFLCHHLYVVRYIINRSRRLFLTE